MLKLKRFFKWTFIYYIIMQFLFRFFEFLWRRIAIIQDVLFLFIFSLILFQTRWLIYLVLVIKHIPIYNIALKLWYWWNVSPALAIGIIQMKLSNIFEWDLLQLHLSLFECSLLLFSILRVMIIWRNWKSPIL